MLSDEPSGCNLHCAWCDTPYASWQPEGSSLSIDALVAAAQASGVRHAVLTGGEPMMFPTLPDLAARLADRAAMHITIETAGTILPVDGLPVCHLMSISPKLANSTPRNDPRDPTGAWSARHEERRLNIPVLQRLLDEFGPDARQFKFVVTAEVDRDLAEIDALLARLRGIVPSDILLMPEGVTPPTAGHRAAVVAACIARGWRYCSRLHIELFGNRRGT
jgi:7-carboxy-7-deazaguanine synthase